ncbi:LysE family translocator [Salinimonas chungwhensis]|uniref:LysE family translocator n=1 Tax=Salinimonas chungwhensis TaxID=265425 RepID=UPI00035FAFB8|nr:LysE family translocator [Salinimonas chungwhensis]
MPDMHLLAAFVAATLVLTLSPGPSNLYIMACTLNNGPRAGINAALGMAIGSCIYVMLSAVGMSALVLHHPEVFVTIQVCGAVYLLYLGAVTLHGASASSHAVASIPSKRHLIRESLTVELTNPKTILFFIAFLPQFTHMGSLNISLQFALLGMLYTVLAFGSDILMVAMTSWFGKMINAKTSLRYWQEILAGSVLCILGITLIGQEIIALIK